MDAIFRAAPSTFEIRGAIPGAWIRHSLPE